MQPSHRTKKTDRDHTTIIILIKLYFLTIIDTGILIDD